MNYPDDFNTDTFPAGKSIAISRAMGVGIMAAFFVIMCLCGLIIWTLQSARIEPYVLATGGINDRWRIIMSGDASATAKMTDVQIFQQSLIWQFTQNWFNISPSHETNAAVWDTQCKHEDCMSGGIKAKKCALFCAASDELFYRFSDYVLPNYQAYEASGATWIVDPESIRIEPTGPISNDGGAWQVQATVLTGGTGAMDIVAYAQIGRNVKYFPATRGYFVADFNAYRVSQ